MGAHLKNVAFPHQHSKRHVLPHLDSSRPSAETEDLFLKKRDSVTLCKEGTIMSQFSWALKGLLILQSFHAFFCNTFQVKDFVDRR